MPYAKKTDPDYIRAILRQTPIDMVLSDLDGTLLDPDSQVPEAVVDAVKRLTKTGIRFMVASGRPKMAVLETMAALEIEEPYIAGGGAYVADPHTERAILHMPLSREAVEKIVFLARQVGVSILFEELEIAFQESSDENAALLKEMAGFPIPRTDDILSFSSNPTTKIVLMGDPDVLTNLDLTLAALSEQAHVATTFPIFRDITAAGITKGTALKALAGYTHISPDRILTIGDGWNDKSMFDVSALGVAVANATPDVLAIADMIAPSNADHGVAWIIQQVIETRTPAAIHSDDRKSIGRQT